MQRAPGLALVLLTALAAASVAVAASATYTAHMSGGSEVPAVETKATGQAVFRLSKDGTAVTYKLIVGNIDNVVASHIHLAPSGVNGPVVAFLYGNAPAGGGPSNGVLSEGTITAANLIGPLAGQPLSALVAALESGDAYVNVHTNDGVPPTNTGAGDVASGEIRAQIR